MEYLLLMCLKILVWCLCQLPVLFEKLPVDFGADVEDWISCCWFEFDACVLVCHLMLKVVQCLALCVGK